MKVILGISGSIAAVESVHICTELRRLGHDVFVVMSDAARKIVHPHALHLASGNRVVEELTGDAEHIKLVEGCDAMLIAPCTANTISKVALGIGDNALTTTALTALGKIPLVIAPAMHLSLLQNPAVEENLEKLKKFGVKVIPPVISEERAKMYGKRVVHIFLHEVCEELKGKKFAVVGGSGVEFLDEIRVISNLSTGRTALEIAKNIYIRGGDVVLFKGIMRCDVPDYIPSENFLTVQDLMSKDFGNFDAIFVPAALPDYRPEKMLEGKYKGEELEVKLKRTPRFLEFLRISNSRGIIVGFKAEVNMDEESLIKSAKEIMEKYSLDIVVANDFRKVSADSTECLILKSDGCMSKFCGSKEKLARILVDIVADMLKR